MLEGWNGWSWTLRLRKIVLKNDVASSKNVKLYQFFQKLDSKFCPKIYFCTVVLENQVSQGLKMSSKMYWIYDVLQFLIVPLKINLKTRSYFSIQNLLPLSLNRQPMGLIFCQNIKNWSPVKREEILNLKSGSEIPFLCHLPHSSCPGE